MTENITDYGAEPNPEDPDIEAARKNVVAIRDAANAAGANGTIYVPSGSYYCGSNDRLFNLVFGNQEPAGISWVGDGPNESIVATTEHMDKDDQSHVFMRYNEQEQGTVEISDIQFFGNAKNLDGLKSGSTSRSQFCVLATSDVGPGTVNCTNVVFKEWFDQAIENHVLDWNVDQCTFFEVGSESRKLSESGHCITMHAGADLTLQNSLIERVGSFALNYRTGDGTMTVDNCYIESFGTGLLKLSAGSQMEFRNSYVEGNTSWTENNYPDRDGIDFKGRFFVDQLVDRNNTRKEVIFTDCELRDCLEDGIKCKHRIKLDMNNTAMYNNNIDNQRPGAIVARDGGDLQCDMSGQAISVHNTNGHALDITPDSTGSGTIGTLIRNNNTEGLGNTDDITIENDNFGGDPLSPNTPNKNDVGANTTTSSPTSGETAIAFQTDGSKY